MRQIIFLKGGLERLKDVADASISAFFVDDAVPQWRGHKELERIRKPKLHLWGLQRPPIVNREGVLMALGYSYPGDTVLDLWQHDYSAFSVTPETDMDCIVIRPNDVIFGKTLTAARKLNNVEIIIT